MSQMFVIFVSMLIAVNAQRSPYAGGRPGSGYKDRFVPSGTLSSVATSTAGTVNTVDLGDRLGVGSTQQIGITSTSSSVPSPIPSTDRLPYDAYGDQFIVNHFNSLPVEQRPFWLVNQGHIEAQRGTPSRPSGSTQATTSSSAQDVVNRFGERPIQQQPINQNTVPTQQEVIYPANITPEQRLDMEIQFLQQRLNELIERRRQLQNQDNQLNLSNAQARRF